MRIKAAVLAAVISVSSFSFVANSSGQVLFADDFDSGQSFFLWSANQGGGTDSSADFAFDYSQLGIPSAPNSSGGSTIGLKFVVNPSANVFQGISASPIDQHFTGDFEIRLDLWMNFVGPFPGGGNGSTQMASFGWGTSGTTAQWAGAKHSLIFAGSGDGGTNPDYRAYLNEYIATGAPIDVTSGVYAAGTASGSTNNSNAYYASLGGETAPAAQTAMYSSQTGTTAVGSLGFAWRDVIIRKNGNVVTWSIDGLLIATVAINNFAALGGDNIFVGAFDINGNSSNDPADPDDLLTNAIYDNIRVTVIPEPASACFLAVAIGGLCARRRRAPRPVTPAV